MIIQVFLKTISGKILTVDIDEDATCGELINTFVNIQIPVGNPSAAMKIILDCQRGNYTFAGKRFYGFYSHDPSKKIKEIGISKESTIHEVLKFGPNTRGIAESFVMIERDLAEIEESKGELDQTQCTNLQKTNIRVESVYSELKNEVSTADADHIELARGHLNIFQPIILDIKKRIRGIVKDKNINLSLGFQEEKENNSISNDNNIELKTSFRDEHPYWYVFFSIITFSIFHWAYKHFTQEDNNNITPSSHSVMRAHNLISKPGQSQSTTTVAIKSNQTSVVSHFPISIRQRVTTVPGTSGSSVGDTREPVNTQQNQSQPLRFT